MSIRGFVDRSSYQQALDFSRHLVRSLTPFPEDKADADRFISRYPWRDGYSSLPYGELTPTIMWSGIYGVGVQALSDNRFTPIILVDNKVEGYLPDIFKVEFEISLPDNFRIIYASPPLPQSAICLCQGRRSTLGADVYISEGRVGVLTAGHIASPIGEAILTESGNLIGEVVFTESPGMPPVLVAHADVAVVEVHDLNRHQERGLKPGFQPQPGERETVAMIHADGRRIETSISTAAEWIYSPELGGRWGEVYLTDEVISDEGDSGAPVVISDTSVIGHVVGVIPDLGTLVQDLEYQLAHAGVDLL